MNASAQIVGANGLLFQLGEHRRVFEVVAAQLLRICDGRGVMLRVVDGAAWITQDGDLTDGVLEPGQDLVLDRDGVCLVAPLGNAPLRVVVANARAEAHAQLRWLPLARPARPAPCG